MAKWTSKILRAFAALVAALLFVGCAKPTMMRRPHRDTYLFAHGEGRIDWTHLTSGEGNEFRDDGAHMANFRGRSFLLNTKPRGRDLEIEVTACKEQGPAYAWILPRWKDVDNFYEVVLKEVQVEVWRKDRGEYYGILPNHQLLRNR